VNRPVVLAVVGFFIGGSLTGYFEWKSHVPGSARAGEAESRTGEHEGESVPGLENHQPDGEQRTQSVGQTRAHGARRSKREEARPAGANNHTNEKPVQSSRDTRREQAKPDDTRRTDSRFPFHIHLKRVLVGEDVIAAGILSESAVEEHAKHDKYIVYLEFSFTNDTSAGRRTVSCRDFRLEDNGGLIYSPLQSSDYLSAELGPAKTASGGFAFALYNDSAPARLLYRTGGERFIPLPENIFWDRRDEGASR
jgi:hypothetical protein